MERPPVSCSDTLAIAPGLIPAVVSQERLPRAMLPRVSDRRMHRARCGCACGVDTWGGVARVVIPKDEAATRRHIMVAIFESDDAGAQLKKFLEVEYRPIGKRR